MNQDVALHRSNVGYASPSYRQLYQSVGGDESSQDDESTLKCVRAWSATDSAHSSTSELSSSSEDRGQGVVGHAVDAEFEWVRPAAPVAAAAAKPTEPPPRNSQGKMTDKAMHAMPRNFSKPPKVAAKANASRQKHSSDDAQECVSHYSQSDAQQSELRRTPVSYDKSEEFTSGRLNNNFEEYEADVANHRVARNTDYLQKNMETFQAQDMELSEMCQNNKYLVDAGSGNHPQLGYNANMSKLPPAFDKTGSLDRRRKSSNRSGRDKKCRSSILSQCQSPRFRSPSRASQPEYSDAKPHKRYDSNWSLCHEAHGPTPTAHCGSNVCSCHRQEVDYCKLHKEELLERHERLDPQRYGSSGMLSQSRHCLLGSQQELNHCCGSYMPPPCHALANSCWHCSNSRWRLFKGGGGMELEERLKRLEVDKEQLQLQVAVLMEQVDAQSDKIADQEKLLADRKRQLAGTEDLLQSEMLSRSSLETQKLELLSVMSDLKLQLAGLDRDNLELRRRQQHKPPPGPTRLATSTPVGATLAPATLAHMSPTPSPVSSMSDTSPRRINHQNSLEDLKDMLAQNKCPVEYPRRVDHYASLPRQRANGVAPLEGGTSAPPPLGGVRKGVAFAETESIVIVDRVDGPGDEDEDDMRSSLSSQHSPMQNPQHVKAKGIKKMLGKMTRSGSGNLDELSYEGELKRGGVRATAGPRLGWSSAPHNTLAKAEDTRLPFVEWDCSRICLWLQDMGLECYVGDARRWVKSGAQLLAASAHEIDKELGVKNTLHRKKLQLALLSRQANVTAVDPDLRLASQLDTSWVLRWLDDTGLPQHKEAFLAARVDGRVLHRLTMDDLVTLHVTSHLHVASLRRGIQVLRTQGFQPDCLQRRSIPGDPDQVVLWTNHRVMEWLRVVDLAEYAPNLRGSGVHGGLMFFEARFTAELLASLLAIPPGKTLLRRHLNTHFKELLGNDCIQEKREAEATLGYIPLTPTTKLKVVKKSQFTLKRKKSRSELEFGDLVCPLDPSKSDDVEPSPKGRGCLSGN